MSLLRIPGHSVITSPHEIREGDDFFVLDRERVMASNPAVVARLYIKAFKRYRLQPNYFEAKLRWYGEEGDPVAVTIPVDSSEVEKLPFIDIMIDPSGNEGVDQSNRERLPVTPWFILLGQVQILEPETTV